MVNSRSYRRLRRRKVERKAHYTSPNYKPYEIPAEEVRRSERYNNLSDAGKSMKETPLTRR